VKQKRYTEGFKHRMVQRMSGPEGVSAGQLSSEVGVAPSTLWKWKTTAGRLGSVKKSKPSLVVPRRPEDWSAEEKLSAVLESASQSEMALGSWLRERGLTAEHLSQWREQALSGFEGRAKRRDPSERKRVKELERDLRRKDKALAETAALLVLQGKVQALWAGEEESTRQPSDESSSPTSSGRKKRGRG